MSLKLGEIPEFPCVKLSLDDWRDGIVVRMPNWLGDTVMALPALHQLRLATPPDCGLFVVCAPQLLELFELIPEIDLLIPLSAAHRRWGAREKGVLFHTRAGIGLLFNNSLRDVFYFRRCGIPRLYGAAARGRSILLSRAFRFPRRRDCELHGLHHAARYLAMSYALGAPVWDGDFPAFEPVYTPETMDIDTLAALERENILAVAPGAAYGDAKRWASERFQAVCRAWIESHSGSVILLGTAGERAIAERVAESLPPGKVANLAGKTKLGELVSVLRKAKFCIANDSGIMHLAAAIGTPGTAIFGSTDPSATGPLSESWNVIYKQQKCSPCFKRSCPFGHRNCLNAISVEELVATLPGAAQSSDAESVDSA